jgi:hypothetical protein
MTLAVYHNKNGLPMIMERRVRCSVYYESVFTKTHTIAAAVRDIGSCGRIPMVGTFGGKGRDQA